jgi:hypothetical protein
MPKITEADILARAKANCAALGLQWDVAVSSRTTKGAKLNNGVLDESAHQTYLTEAHRQLLEESAKKSDV